ncbi:MAG: hypothetical protein E7484_03060 [Ruminococcaceae bacterium]|nr:hypothetical protein [Oscillospiraceae bacterium]
MKFFKLIILSAVLLLTACSDYGEKRIVKLVTVNKENISFYYYDFKAEKPSFVIEQKQNTGIENTMTDILSENDYNLKLCSFVVCDKAVVEDNIGELVSALFNSRFSPDVSVVAGNTEEDCEKYTYMQNGKYPLHSYNMSKEALNGVVENAETHEKYVIYNSKTVRTLDDRKSFAVDAAGNAVTKGVYTFDNQGKTLTANLENINTFYSTENGMVNVTLSAILKNYKGMPANKESKQQFINLLEYNLDKDIRDIYEDSILTECLNLDWFRKAYNTDKIKVNIIIK